MKAETTIEHATKILVKYLRECDTDDFCAIFDEAFGTESYWDPETEVYTIEPGNEYVYGGVIEQEFKETIVEENNGTTNNN